MYSKDQSPRKATNSSAIYHEGDVSNYWMTLASTENKGILKGKNLISLPWELVLEEDMDMKRGESILWMNGFFWNQEIHYLDHNSSLLSFPH